MPLKSEELLHHGLLVDEVTMKRQYCPYVVGLHSLTNDTTLFQDCLRSFWDISVVNHPLHLANLHSVSHTWLLSSRVNVHSAGIQGIFCIWLMAATLIKDEHHRCVPSWWILKLCDLQCIFYITNEALTVSKAILSVPLLFLKTRACCA